MGISVINRQLLRHSKSSSPRNNAHLVNWIGSRCQLRHKRMTGFMKCSISLLCITQNHAAPFYSHQHFVFCKFKINLIDLFFGFPRSNKGSLVHKVCQVRTRKARRSACDSIEVNIISKGYIPGMDLQYCIPPFYVRRGNNYLAVKPPWSQQRGVKDIRPVRRGNNDDTLITLEAVHLNKQSVQGLLPLIMSAAKTSASVSSDSVNLIYKYDAWRALLCLVEKIPHP